MAEINPLSELYKDILTTIEQCVIKYKAFADDAETVTSKKNADEYIRAYLQEDRFNTYYNYDVTLLAQVTGITNKETLESMHLNKNLIPDRYRNELLLRTRAKIINDFVETNNYYRILNGLPDYGDVDYIYPDESYVVLYRLPSDKPIHEYTDAQINTLKAAGHLDELIKRYPKAKYLEFLGSGKVDIVTARRSLNFALLRSPYGVSETFWNSFTLLYNQCREYFTSCIYIAEYRQTIDYYDNFIAMCIMVMTLQQLVARVIKNTIDRDFFDEYLIRMLFGSYEIPYYAFMDDSTKKHIVQNLNLLVLNKGTNQVLYDIASILGFDRISIFKYYLMRTQLFDSNGVPAVIYKTNELTGEQELDYEKMFDVYFQKVEIKDMDTYRTMLDRGRRVEYDEITRDDPYWYEDQDLFDEIYKSEYNFIETKYLGISISYKMSRILFENIYLLKMILEHKDEIKKLRLELPRLNLYADVSLFDAIITLSALACKQNHLRGEILYDMSKIMHVMGFDFSKDFETIRNDIMNNPHLDGDEMMKFFTVDNNYTPAAINDMYHNFLGLYEYIVNKLTVTQDIEVYQAYMKLYYSLFYTDENREVFSIGTEEDNNLYYPATFLEYLEYSNPELYEVVNEANEQGIYELVTHISSKIMKFVDDIKYLGWYAGTSETVESMLVELVDFFKSYTTDLLGLEIVYVFDLKPENLMRLIDRLTLKVRLWLDDNIKLPYSDSLTFTSSVSYETKFKILDTLRKNLAVVWLADPIKLFDMIKFIIVNEDMNDSLSVMDVIGKIISIIHHDARICMDDMCKLVDTIAMKDNVTTEDIVRLIIEEISVDKMSVFDTADVVAQHKHNQNLKLSDKCLIFYDENA